MDSLLTSVVGLTVVALNIGLCIAVAILASAHRRMGARVQQVMLAAQSDNAAMCSAALGMGQRLDVLEDKVRRQTERMEQRDLSEPLRQSYRQAMQLIDSGADVQMLVDRCGVTRGEAELLANLNKMAAEQAEQRVPLAAVGRSRP